LVDPLIGYDQPILGRVGRVDQTHGNMLAMRAEWHGLLASQPGHEVFIGTDQAIGLHGKNAGTEVVDDLISPVRLCGNLGGEFD